MNPLTVNSSIHTNQYEKWGTLLSGQQNYNSKNEPTTVTFYTPDSAHAVYAITKYMRDDELLYINQTRQRAGKETLPRLAYIGDFCFIPVKNQAERYAKEQEVFKDYQVLDVEKLAMKIGINGKRL